MLDDRRHSFDGVETLSIPAQTICALHMLQQLVQGVKKPTISMHNIEHYRLRMLSDLLLSSVV